MMRQYHRVKDEFPDGILFFRMGDFYEMFGEDAVIAANALSITLTRRHGVPMCGVPHHAKDNYLKRLVEQGFKVAICEQLQDPKTVKGLVDRGIVEILTPGTHLGLDENRPEHNFVAAVQLGDNFAAFALLDLSVGEVIVMEEEDQQPLTFLFNELLKYPVRELLINGADEPDWLEKYLSHCSNRIAITNVDSNYFRPDAGKDLLLETYKLSSLRGFDLDNATVAISLTGAFT